MIKRFLVLVLFFSSMVFAGDTLNFTTKNGKSFYDGKKVAIVIGQECPASFYRHGGKIAFDLKGIKVQDTGCYKLIKIDGEINLVIEMSKLFETYIYLASAKIADPMDSLGGSYSKCLVCIKDQAENWQIVFD
jgi:hypothetical protein